MHKPSFLAWDRTCPTLVDLRSRFLVLGLLEIEFEIWDAADAENVLQGYTDEYRQLQTWRLVFLHHSEPTPPHFDLRGFDYLPICCSECFGHHFCKSALDWTCRYLAKRALAAAVGSEQGNQPRLDT